jgi:hypothetical protein
VKLPITPDNLQEIDYYCTWPVLPYSASTLRQLRRLIVSLSRGVDLEAFLRELSSIHSLIELAILGPKAHNHSQPILSELKALTCPVILVQYLARCPLLTLDISPDWRAFGTRFPRTINGVDIPIPTFPSLHALVIPNDLLIKVAAPLGEKFPHLHALDLQCGKYSNPLTTLTSPHERLIHLCNLSPLSRLETLIMRHLLGTNDLNLVEQRNWLDNPIKNAFPSLTKASFSETVDWYWSDEQKYWTPFIPFDERQYVPEREDEWVDYKGYLECVVHHITVQEEEPPMVRVSVSFGRLNLT